MTDLVLIVGFIAIFGVGSLIWKFARANGAAAPSETHIRRRENARDWQRRLGPDSLLHANFHPPTQNEILETLYVLDFLMPGWETVEAEEAERRFLHELALSFPTLRKTPCAFPLPFAEIWKPTGKPASPRSQEPVLLQAAEAELAAKREGYRLSRAHSNALEQITAGSAAPAQIVPGRLPFRPSDVRSHRRAGNPWFRRLAGGAVLSTAVLATGHFLLNPARFRSIHQQFPEVSTLPVPQPSPEIANPSPVAPDVPKLNAEASFAPVPAPTAAMPAAPPRLTPAAPSVATQEKAALDQKIAASKQRAVSKYPALAVDGSEINLRFVFRYKNLVQTNSPRLREPDWPERLADECAAAAHTPPRHDV